MPQEERKMEQFAEGESTREEIKNKLRQNFDGKIVRKDLTKKIKEGANVPVYVLEFLLGQYCSSDDETVIEKGVQNVKRILADNFVRPDESQKILSQLRKKGSHTIIDMVTVRLDMKKDCFFAEFSNLGVGNVPIADEYPEKFDRLLCGLKLFLQQLLFRFVLTSVIDVYGNDNQCTTHNVLPEGGQPQKGKAVIQHIQGNHAQDGSSQTTLAAIQAHAADNDRRNNSHFKANASRGLAGTHTGAEDHRRKSCQTAGNNVGNANYPVHRNACQLCRFLVAADGVNVSAKHRMPQHIIKHTHKNHQKNHGHRNPQHMSHTNLAVGRNRALDGSRVGQHQSRTGDDRGCTQGANQGGDIHLCNNQAVHKPHSGAYQHAGQNAQKYILGHIQHIYRRHACQGLNGAYGEVNASQKNQHGHANGADSILGTLPQDIFEIIQCKKLVAEKRHQDAQGNQGQKQGKLLFFYHCT